MPQLRPLVLLAFHWHIDTFIEGAQQTLMDRGFDVAILNSDTAAALAGRPAAGILGMFAADPAHPVRRFADAFAGPVVELSLAHPEFTQWGRVHEDCEAIARLAAGRLRRLPVRSFLFVAGGSWWNHDARWETFRRELAADSRPCERCDTGDLSPAGAERLAARLLTLPRPVAVFGSTDEWARQALEAADLAGLRVPGEVYILGFSNRMFSRVSPVPLSTIVIDHAAWAKTGAELLVEMIAGRVPPGTRRRFAPGELIERASTAGETGGHPLCDRALALMRETVSEPLAIPALAKRLGVSKTTLERAFLNHMGMRVAKRYLDLRIEEATALLVAGEKIEYVATRVGFDSLRGFTHAFKRVTGRAPSAFSKGARAAGGA